MRNIGSAMVNESLGSIRSRMPSVDHSFARARGVPPPAGRAVLAADSFLPASTLVVNLTRAREACPAGRPSRAGRRFHFGECSTAFKAISRECRVLGYLLAARDVRS
jgi:hypothetical protein